MPKVSQDSSNTSTTLATTLSNGQKELVLALYDQEKACKSVESSNDDLRQQMADLEAAVLKLDITIFGDEHEESTGLVGAIEKLGALVGELTAAIKENFGAKDP